MISRALSTWRTEMDGLTQAEWAETLDQFDDACVYQSWPYGSVRWGEGNLSHLVLRDGAGAIASAAQARIVRLPLSRAGIAYVTWGPMWRRRGRAADVKVFREAVRALQAEYVEERGLWLRLLPNESSEEEELLRILAEEGFSRNRAPADRTIWFDLTRSESEWLAALKRKFRWCLKSSEQNAFEIEEGDDPRLYEEFCAVYQQMRETKQFVEYVDVDEFREIHRRLPDRHKLHVMVCRLGGESVAANVSSGIGEMAVGFFKATNLRGRESSAGYWLQWRELLYWKAKGCRWYDFSGINPITNPGGYHFKSGFLGKRGENGKDVRKIGRFDACTSRLSAWSVATGDFLRDGYRALRERLNGHQANRGTGRQGNGAEE
ncbi:MAG: GNAT family N-acetyltransferase [Candidatus Sumerlaeota bacterium]|nr:GNAT family N-acetyltransferase [Candidatus Sumerlaeota bacterium]